MLLFILVLIFLIVCIFILLRNILKMNVSTYDTKYYNGPVPTQQQRAINLQSIHEILEQFPNSDLKESYPDVAKSAQATTMYNKLNEDFESGKINRLDYHIRLKEILNMIDININGN